jgi:hypothetical protein
MVLRDSPSLPLPMEEQESGSFCISDKPVQVWDAVRRLGRKPLAGCYGRVCSLLCVSTITANDETSFDPEFPACHVLRNPAPL